MKILIATLFSTALFYACVNGGALRAQEANGAWAGPAGYAGGPGVSGGWTGPGGYAGGPGTPGYAGGPGGGWAGPGGYAGGPGTPGYAGGPGISGGWAGPGGYAGGPGTPGYAGGPGISGGWAGPGGYAGGPGTPGYAGGPGISGRWAGPGGYAGGPGTPGYAGGPGISGGWAGPGGYAGAPGSPGYPGGPGVPGSGNPSGAPIGYTGPTALPQVLPDGTLADVPEVAAAKADHLAATQAAASDPRAADADDGEYDVQKYGDNHHFQQDHYSGGPSGYHGNGFGPAPPSAVPGGPFNDDAAWRARQAAYQGGPQTAYQNPQGHSYSNAEGTLNSLIARNAASAATPSGVSGQPVRPYSGPLATPQVLPSGYLADTEEVAVARQNHLRALVETEAANAQWQQKNSGWN